jgi:hypothetical protein
VANNENLKPFKKGDPKINRKGRPPKLPKLDELMAEVLGKEDDKGMTAAQKILKALYTKALAGDVKAAEILLDRGFGKVRQSHSLTGEDGNPVEVKHLFEITLNLL